MIVSWTAIGLITWFLSLSYFIVINYKIRPWIPLKLSKPIWVLIHAVANVLFSGGIVFSTILEWTIVTCQNLELIHYWFTQQAPRMDKAVVLPALTLSIISGFAQSALDYGSIITAPKHIRCSIHILATFAIWWITTDLTSQRLASKAVIQRCNQYHLQQQGNNNSNNAETLSSSNRSAVPQVLYWRRGTNLVSCGFVFALYALMALKPGYFP